LQAREGAGALRPKVASSKKDFDTLSDQDIEQIERDLDNRPRKRYNFSSLLNMFNKKVAFVT
jgi:IS30 family transposase